MSLVYSIRINPDPMVFINQLVLLPVVLLSSGYCTTRMYRDFKSSHGIICHAEHSKNVPPNQQRSQQAILLVPATYSIYRLLPGFRSGYLAAMKAWQ